MKRLDIPKFLATFLFFISCFCTLPKATAQNSCVGTAGQVKWSYWLNFPSTPDTLMLSALENFPNRPDGSQTLATLQTVPNFNDYYASMIRGYIYVPTTETYKFNLTGDDNCYFYLSTDDTPANKRKRASINGWTNVAEFNKYASQTSQAVTLVGGQNYYFELYQFEGGGGDHVNLYWRKPSNPDTTWRIVDYNNIKDYSCGQNCPARGTACNDGNPATTNDQQDGFCNCVGTLPSTNPCVGTTRGTVEAYYYDNITGNYVEPDLINAPRFPLQPHRKENLKGAYGPLTPSIRDNYGTLVQAYLTVPVTGNYEFNLTGDNQTYFFMSRNDSIQYKQTSQALVNYGVGENEYNASAFQKIGPLYLQKDKYYYIEFRHKENSWRDYFNLHWKTPFYEEKSWKKVPSFYMFDYTCEVACIPAGTPCDDGNPFTNNDQYNNACQCVGTPCTPPNCNEPSANYIPYDPAATTKNLLSDPNSSWLSCNNSVINPNPARSTNYHWIKYDFGDTYQLKSTRVWNYNVAGETNKGFRNVYVDYSMDGTTWTQLGGTYTWTQAPGASDYSGFLGPNFNNLKARYVLISAIDNWGATCAGFSKITFDAQLCKPNGTTCDDLDPLTFHDKFDNNCNCAGVRINCNIDSLGLGNFSLTEAAYKAKKVVSSQSIVPTTKNISFTAGNNIVLIPGFEVKANSVFNAQIANCLSAAFTQDQKATQQLQATKNDSTASEFRSDTTADNLVKRIIFRLNKPAQVKLLLKDANDNIVTTIIDDYYQNLGTQIKYLPTAKLSKGEYWIELTVNEDVLKEQIVVN